MVDSCRVCWRISVRWMKMFFGVEELRGEGLAGKGEREKRRKTNLIRSILVRKRSTKS